MMMNKTLFEKRKYGFLKSSPVKMALRQAVQRHVVAQPRVQVELVGEQLRP